MIRATPISAPRSATIALDASAAVWRRPADRVRGAATDLHLELHTALADVESEWRGFENGAECTPFQSFEWLSAWHRHVGVRHGVVPAIALGRYGDGNIAFVLPLAVAARCAARRLCFLGQELCDYNAPLLARDFSQRITPDRFIALWRELRQRLQHDARLRHDWIDFEKMPQTVGVQLNPFMHLPVMANANSAHLTYLGEAWDEFYRMKRSSATRRHDRSKRRRMETYGPIQFRSAVDASETAATLEILWEQNRRLFARKGIADIFAQPGYRDFFLDFAINSRSRHLAHVSRLDIGDVCAAANFAIVFDDCYYHVLASYCDGQLAHYGPGALHLRELMTYAIGRGLRRFDFTIGDEHYKNEWCDLRLQLFDYSAGASWRGRPSSAMANLRRSFKRFVKQTPALWQLALRLRAAFGALTTARSLRAPGGNH